MNCEVGWVNGNGKWDGMSELGSGMTELGSDEN